jgi:energy-converting hydrogenase B subunit D
MSAELDLFTLLLFPSLLALALAALHVRDLLAAVFLLSGYSFVTALLMAHMGAVDVGFTEASVGAGLTGVFFLMAIAQTSRRSGD